MAILECNKTVQTSMVWFAYEVDADSHNKVPNVLSAQVELQKGVDGIVEKLSEIQVLFHSIFVSDNKSKPRSMKRFQATSQV